MQLFPLRFIPDNTNINFVRTRLIFFVLSALLVIASITSLAVQGLNYGIDFTGGVLVEARTETLRDLGQLRTDLNTRLTGEISLTTFGGDDRNLMIRVPEQPGGDAGNAVALTTLKDILGEGVDYRKTELVGPKVGGELVTAGILAVVFSILAITAYIWFRFEWQFAVGALISLIHDVIATVGIYSLFQLPFDLTSVAAILTVAGYSVNDTVVVFDRMREEMRRYKKMPLPEVINFSVNKTLSRTIMTSGTTLLALACLFVFGGDVLRIFSLAIIWGILIGTYSSIFLAAPTLLYLRFTRSGEDAEDSPTSPPVKTGRTRSADGSELEAASGADLAARAAFAESQFLGDDDPNGRRTRRSGVVTGRSRPKS